MMASTVRRACSVGELRDHPGAGRQFSREDRSGEFARLRMLLASRAACADPRHGLFCSPLLRVFSQDLLDFLHCQRAQPLRFFAVRDFGDRDGLDRLSLGELVCFLALLCHVFPLMIAARASYSSEFPDPRARVTIGHKADARRRSQRARLGVSAAACRTSPPVSRSQTE